jgi:chromate reductase
MSFTVGYFVGSLSERSINRILAIALIRLAPQDLELREIPIRDLPLYNRDLDDDYPPPARALKANIEAVDALLFVTPEYNRDIPGSLKNAIDWASRPWGTNSLSRKPSAVIGASTGKIGTAVAQQNLRSILSFCNSPQMNAPEAYNPVYAGSDHRGRGGHRGDHRAVPTRLHAGVRGIHRARVHSASAPLVMAA